jgi:DNA (cytosine-5)-methyltransferase 1
MKSIELFAGAGGLAIGTARAGFEHEALIEWDHNACDTLRLNRHAGSGHKGEWTVVEGDVREYDFAQHAGHVQFISGGPPCQPFSMGGKHLGQADARNMFPQAIRAVREIQPMAFMFENVRGLLRRNFANYYSYIIRQLEFPELTPRGDEGWTDHLARLEKSKTSGRSRGLTYNIVYQLLDAADFGVPQHRYRVFIVGVRSDLGVEFSFPKATHFEDALLYAKWVSGDYWLRHGVGRRSRPRMPEELRRKVQELRQEFWPGLGEPWRTVRDAIGDLPELGDGETCADIPNHYQNRGAKSYPGHTGSDLDEPAKALKAGDHGVPGGENTVRTATGGVRYLTVRECARIQTFPDEWVLQGSWTESMRQLGNAVPVTLAEVVSDRLRAVLCGTPAIK